MTHRPIAIVGGGPAGIACAIQLYHAGLHPLLIERYQLGGLLRSANWVENYPGFPGGIPGSNLAQLFTEQIKRFKPDFTSTQVKAVNWDEKLFQIESDNQSLTAEILIIATGTKPKPQPAFCCKPELLGRIYSEIIPLLGEKGKTIAVVGSGDAAFDYALNLASANDVTIFSRSPQPKCLPLLAATVRLNPHIRCYPGWEISNIAADTDGRLLLSTHSFSATSTIPFDFVLFAIGREPDLGCLSPSLITAQDQLVGNGRLFLIGDVINGDCRQTAIAVGQGVQAAMQIIKGKQTA